MGVRVYRTDSLVNGAHRGLIGPDADGKIKLPSLKRQNLFLRDGTCGSAPLYHQERMPRYKLVGSPVRVECFYDDEINDEPHGSMNRVLTVSRGTWAIYARMIDGDCYCWHYFSENGKCRAIKTYCHYYSKEKEEFIRVIRNDSMSVYSRVMKCKELCNLTSQDVDSWWVWMKYGYARDVEVVPIDGVLSHKYLDFWELATETGVVIPPSDLCLALSKASEDLAASLPQTPINIAEALVDLVSVKNISNLFRTSEKVSAMLADSWLKWRYVYTTTKLDVRSMQEFLNRGLSLFDGVTKKDYSCHGYAHIGDITCRCSTTLHGKDLKEQFRRASQSLHTYDLWDLVPWSFVVDWFIPIGSMLQNLEYQNNLLKIEHGTIWYTCKWYEDSATENFMRFCTNNFVTTPCSIVNNQGPTNKTIAMRCIDAMALLIGR